MIHDWQPAETAPKDGTHILGLNNRGNFAVCVWLKTLRGEGWVHPFTTLQFSPFWNGACGSVMTHWQRMIWPPDVCAAAFMHFAITILKGKTEICPLCEGAGFMPETALGQRYCIRCDGAGSIDGLTALRRAQSLEARHDNS